MFADAPHLSQVSVLTQRDFLKSGPDRKPDKSQKTGFGITNGSRRTL
jgi:hypothetical protein